jgi:plastocyanin
VEDGLSIGLVISMDTDFNTATLPVTEGTITGSASCAASTHIASQGRMKWEIQVGSQDELSFAPEQIAASTGDIVEFTFFQNHTVTQSSLDTPCVPLLGGFSTGFNQYNPGLSDNVKVAFTVNSPESQYFFCAQTDPFAHCELGMVFAINAGTQMNTFLSNVLASGGRPSNASATASSLTTSTPFFVTSPPFPNTTTSVVTQAFTTLLLSNMTDSVAVPIVRTGVPFMYSNSTNGTLTILEVLTPSATGTAIGGSLLASPIGNRAVATAVGMGGGPRSSRVVAGGAVMALAVAIAMAVLG